MKRLIAGLLALLVSMGGGVALAESASAHTPKVWSDCNAVTVMLSSYQPGGKGKKNTVEVQVRTTPAHGPATTETPVNGEFVSSFSGTYAYPGSQYDSHQYRVKVHAWDDPGAKKGWSFDTGWVTVQGCDRPAQPSAEKQTRDVVDAPDCVKLTVTTEHQERSRAYVWDSAAGEWTPGEWSDWATVSTSEREATLEECVNPPLPEPQVEERTVGHPVDCTALTVTSELQRRTREATYVGRELTWGEWSDWVTVSEETRPATLEECPNPALPEAQTQTRDRVKTDCAVGLVVVRHQERSREATWGGEDGRTLVWGEWSKWKTVGKDARDATLAECPVAAESETRSRDTGVDCASGLVTVVTEARSREAQGWLEGQPVFGEWSEWTQTGVGVRQATDAELGECPVAKPPVTHVTPPPAVKPPAPAPAPVPVQQAATVRHVAQVGVARLPRTGSETGPLLAVALGLMLVGGGLAFAGRRRR